MLARYIKSSRRKKAFKRRLISVFHKRTASILDNVRHSSRTLFTKNNKFSWKELSFKTIKKQSYKILKETNSFSKITIKKLRHLKKEDLQNIFTKKSFENLYQQFYKIETKQKIIFSVSLIFIAGIFSIIKHNQNTMVPDAVFRRSVLSSWDYTSDTNSSGIKTRLKKEKTALAVLVERENSRIEFKLPINNPSLEINDNTAVYTNEDKSIEIKYEILPTKLKESIILNVPTTNYEFTSSFLVHNLIVKMNNNNIPVFFDTEDKYQFHLERPYAIDATGTTTFDLTYTLKPKSTTLGDNPFTQKRNNPNNLLELETLRDIQVNTNEYELVVSVNPEWLLSPERQYPIIIDPTIIHDTTAEFAVGIFNRVTDTGSGSAPVLETYYQESSADEHTVGLWHLNEASGNAIDSSGNGNTGTATGTTVVSGLLNNARSFNGTSDYINISSDLGDPTSMTISFWVKLNNKDSGAQYLADGRNGGNWWFLQDYAPGGCSDPDGNICFDNRCEIPSSYIKNNQWHHIVVTDRSFACNIYLDGELIDTGTGEDPDIGTNMRIGTRYTTSGFFKDIIDEFSILNTILTPEEIKASAQRRPYSIYTSPVIDLGTNENDWSAFQKLSWTEAGGKTGDGETLSSTSGLIAQWNFNETNGTVAHNNAGYSSCGGLGTDCDGSLSGFTDVTAQDSNPGSGWTKTGKLWGDGALSFDGSNDYFETDNAVNFAPTPSSSFTIETWVKLNNLSGGGGNRAFLQGADGTGTGRTLLGEVDATSTFYTNIGGVSLVSETTIEAQKWYHLAVTYNGTGESLYVNGKLESSASNVYEANIGKVIFGAFKGYASGFFDGVMDSTRFYTRELSAAEILDNYNNTNVQFQTRAGSDSTPDDGSWESWKPENDYLLKSFDSPTLETRIYASTLGDPTINQTWHKTNNTIPSNSDTTSTDGRIPLGTAGKADELHSYAAAVIKDGDIYKMWYQGRDAANSGRILHATSPDGLTWTKINNTILAASDFSGVNGRIPLGTSGKGDDLHVGYPTVINSNGTYFMWYSGHDGSNWYIFLAISTDGLTWYKQNNSIESPSDSTGTDGRIPLGTSGSGDEGGVLRPTVIKDGNTYKMWYSGIDGTNWRIFYATSPDGLTWTKYDNSVPAASNIKGINGQIPLGGAGTTDSSHAYEPAVIKDGNTYKMWYNMHNGNVRVGYATSNDGLTWKKQNNDIPVASDTTGTDGRIPLGTGSTGDITHSYSPVVIKDGNVYKAWYSGNNGNWRIYSATMSPIPSGDNSDSSFLDSAIKMEGTSSKKLTTGVLQADSNTVGLWYFDENSYSGTTGEIKDSSLFSNDGTANASTTTDKSLVRKGLHHGAGTSALVPDSSSLDIAGPVTIEYWFKPDVDVTSMANTYPVGIFKRNWAVGGYGSHFYKSTGLVNFQWCWVGSCSTIVSTTVFKANQWYYYAATYDGSNAYLYINGLQEATAAVGTPIASSSTYNLILGNAAFEGIIDEVRISNTARTVDEINENYKLGQGHYINQNFILSEGVDTTHDLSDKKTLPFYIAADRPGTYLSAIIGESAYANYQTDKNTVGLWHFEEANGSGAFIMDSSGYGNHGTPAGIDSVEGKVGKGKNFNGTSEDIIISESNILDPTQITLEAWIKPSVMQAGNFICKGSNSGYRFRTLSDGSLQILDRGGTNSLQTSTNLISVDQWAHVAATGDSSGLKIYVNGRLAASNTTPYGGPNTADDLVLGAYGVGGTSEFYSGKLDEVRISNIARTSSEIRQAYEVGKRTHSITIDFAASGDAVNLITGSGDTSFTIDATAFGLSNKGSNLHKGDKIIVRENYNGDKYHAQGTVDSINESTGAVTVSSWDNDSTFPSGGYTANAEFFKWQREYFDISSSLKEHRNTTGLLSLQLTNGHEGRTIWLDDFRAAGDYLTTPLSSTISSTTGNRYVQYRTIFTATDTLISGSLSSVTMSSYNGSSSSSGSCYLEESRHDNNITVHWTDNDTNEIGFEIEKRINGTTWQTVDITSPNSSYYSDENISSGNTYQYRVRSRSDDGATGAWCATSVVDLSIGNFQLEGLQLEGIKLD